MDDAKARPEDDVGGQSEVDDIEDIEELGSKLKLDTLAAQGSPRNPSWREKSKPDHRRIVPLSFVARFQTQEQTWLTTGSAARNLDREI
jgi:hypothetical protein